MKKRKTTVRGVKLREKNGRTRRVSQRDHGTPETQARKLLAAAICDAPGRHDASATGFDFLWRAGKIDDGEWGAAFRYGRLYRLCSENPGIRSGAATGGGMSDLVEEQAALRKMQASLTPMQRSVITDVCGLLQFPDWLVHSSRERRELVRGLKVLDKGTHPSGRSRVDP